MAETSDVVNPRRSSVFVKRGSVSMEPIKKVTLEEVYHVYKQVTYFYTYFYFTDVVLGTGRFGYIKLAEHKQSKQKIAIKFFPRPQTKQVDFVREYNYSFFLSPHPQIIDTYEGMYQAKLTDFGLTRKVDAAVKYLEYVNNYHAPELCETVVNEVLTVNKSTDIWALGMCFHLAFASTQHCTDKSDVKYRSLSTTCVYRVPVDVFRGGSLSKTD
ncbi:hypothetical protein ANCDUO_02808 [Ancylostoma duodenale]|uniref:Protein kinase domain-containing protein n=1 Tax=Ancylostoma duodenale TaxID=51022 RepID=A0A0C2DVK0_9BILA|nr:hypothetical protein ANCDUO_02808 [Ancylostoma duodenale]